MGSYLARHGKTRDSVVLAAHEVHHQWSREGKPRLSIDSARDFLELTRGRKAPRAFIPEYP